MSAVNVYTDEEEVFALSFANHVISDDSIIANDNHTVGVPPPLLSDSPSGLSEPDDELSYQEELFSSPLLYKSERLISHTPKNYTYAASNNDDIIFTLDNEEESSEDLVIIPQQTARPANVSTYDDEFANAAQQNYRLWLSSF